jgi:hypothetical protein
VGKGFQNYFVKVFFEKIFHVELYYECKEGTGTNLPNKKVLKIQFNPSYTKSVRRLLMEPTIFTKKQGGYLWMSYITPGKSVEIHTYHSGELVNVNAFNVGDQAEYEYLASTSHLYRRRIYGPIVSITDKSVTVRKGPHISDPRATANLRPQYKNRRMNWDDFTFRNHNFNLDYVLMNPSADPCIYSNANWCQGK